MDIKTLEYMGQRVDKARAALKAIERRKEKITNLEKAKTYGVKLTNSNAADFYFGDTAHGDHIYGFSEKMRQRAIELLNEEIETLEKELTEL